MAKPVYQNLVNRFGHLRMIGWQKLKEADERMVEFTLEEVPSLVKSGQLMEMLKTHRYWTTGVVDIAADIGMNTKEDRKELTGIVRPLTDTNLSEDQVAEKAIVDYWQKKGKNTITLDECLAIFTIAKTLLREARKQRTPTMIRIDINPPR